MEANLRVFTSTTCQLPPAHTFNIAWITQQRSLHTLSCMPGKRPDVRAASSSVPWRNAQPTSPSTAPTEAEAAAADSSSVRHSSNAPTKQHQQPKMKDLVGYTAVLSSKAVNKQEDRVLGIVKEVCNAFLMFLFGSSERKNTLTTAIISLFLILYSTPNTCR